MKKITLSIGLLAGVLTSNAQDTLKFEINEKKSYIFEACDRVLTLHFSDNKYALRKATYTYPNGDTYVYIITHEDKYVHFDRNVEVHIGKPRFIIKL